MKSFKDYLKEDKGALKHHQYQKSFAHAQMHAIKHKDIDADGDIDKYDYSGIPDEITGTEKDSKKLQKAIAKKETGEKKHTKIGNPFE